MTVSFNLWDDPWIRVLRPDGGREELGIYATLLRAHELRALHDPSPLTVAGIHRLLTAILQSIYAPESLGEIAAILESGSFDQAQLDAFGAQFRHRFGLFDPTAPFMQTADAPAEPGKEAKTVAYLLTEVPTGTNRAHFHHVTDDAHRLCPACCARALVVVPAFASAAGRPYRPSINGVPPIYLLPTGAILLQGLTRSLTTADYQPAVVAQSQQNVAVWSGEVNVPKIAPVQEVGYIESLAFPARRMRLYPQHYQGRCTRCGAYCDEAVSWMLLEMGKFRQSSTLWHDPFVAFRTTANKDITSVKPQPGRAIWREYGTLLLSQDKDLQPAILAQTRSMIDSEYLDREVVLHFRCIGIRTDQAKSIEWFDETLDVPPALLHDAAGAQVVRQALERADTLDRAVSSTFASAFLPHKDREWFQTLRKRMRSRYWAQLARPFRALILDTGDTPNYDALDRQWASQVLDTGQAVARMTLEQVGDDADLLMRRVRAEQRIGSILGKCRKEWFGE